MKSFITLIFIGIFLSIIGLCATNSHAASSHAKNNAPSVSINNQHIYVSALPRYNDNGYVKSSSITLSSNNIASSQANNLFDQYVENPMLILSNDTLSNISSPLQNNQHSFFEMFALFNDKLQSFLSYFKSSSKVEFVDEISTGTPKAKKVTCDK